MDDKRSQFLILVGEVGRQARLAGLTVDIVTRDGRAFCGVPDPHEAGDAELDDTGLDPVLGVGDATVTLDDVVEVRICSP